MAFRPLTRDLYDMLLAAYRESPGNFTHAANVAGCGRPMAKRGWVQGWPRFPWARPIRKVFDEEKREAIALSDRLAKEAAADAEKKRREARDTSTKAWAEVGNVLTLQRSSILRTAGATSHLSVAVLALAPKLAQAIQEYAKQDKVPIADALTIMTKGTHLIEKLSRAVTAHVAAERVFYADPANKPSDLAHEGDQDGALPDGLTIEEGLVRAQAAQQALTSLKEGHLRVIEGGKARPRAEDFDDDFEEISRPAVGAAHQWNGREG